jgi:hypothetical protein
MLLSGSMPYEYEKKHTMQQRLEKMQAPLAFHAPVLRATVMMLALIASFECVTCVRH